MSIAALTQVYDETRRLAIAGSSLASGDFRLKKLSPPLKKAGAKAPVIGKVAEAIDRLVECPAKESAQALLELSTLVNAILYTQGETGADGKMASIPTSNMEMLATTTSARVIKPLIEALTTTGSGRLEIIRDAQQRGAFQDLRLVNPALAALDDTYGEIGDFVADQVLPPFGKAIYSELKANFDPKGKGGHVHRLRLMHRLDPQATRPLVEEVLETGSKEMKVAALPCLGDSKEHLPHLLEQAGARNKEVRAAALKAIATRKDSEVVDTLVKALSGADLEIAAGPASRNPSPKMAKFLIEDAARQLDELVKIKTKAKQKKPLARFYSFLMCFAERTDKKTVDLLAGFFERRDELAAIKGDVSGEDVNRRVASSLILTGSKPAMKKIADVHETLDPSLLDCAFMAAIETMKPKEVYDQFSPYLRVKAGPKKKRSDPTLQKREAIRDLLITTAYRYDYDYWGRDYDYAHALARLGHKAKLDPRWLDIAIETDDFELVETLARPKHKATSDFLSQKFEAKLKGKDVDYELGRLLQTMLQTEHPRLVEHFLDGLKKIGSPRRRYFYHPYWFARLIPQLPKKAAPKIEEMLPSLPEKVIDALAPYVDELKMKE